MAVRVVDLGKRGRYLRRYLRRYGSTYVATMGVIRVWAGPVHVPLLFPFRFIPEGSIVVGHYSGGGKSTVKLAAYGLNLNSSL